VYVAASSRPYLFIPLTGPVDPAVMAGYVTEIALAPDDGTEPAGADWHTAQWIAPRPGAAPEPCILIGPGGAAAYPAGDYMAWARITAGAEQLVLPSGRVRVGLAA
jgi:hypothetical protein